MSQATIFTEIEGEFVGISVTDFKDNLYDLLVDFYTTYDEAVTLIESGSAAYLHTTLEESDFIDDGYGNVDILSAEDYDEFLYRYTETFTFFFDPEQEEWVQC